MLLRTRHAALLALAVGGAAIAFGAAGSAAASDGFETEGTRVTAAVDGARPTGSSEYAEAAYDAWRADDGAAVVDLAAPEVVELLAARPADGEDWPADLGQCDGAAGSTYCTATSADAQLTLRVANQAASAGVAHAVTQASFTHTAGAVAMWPLTTAEQAWNTQAQVDAGHSPWMVEPEAVVSAYASAELGFADPVVEPSAQTFFTFRVVDAESGVAVDVEVSQPARTGSGGIWAVVGTVSLPADPPVTPL